MKANTAFVPNKKLILHFDVDQVLRLPSNIDKDYFIYELCAGWIWGKVQKNSKEDPDKVTGWKLAVNNLSLESPQAQLITYKTYLQDYLKPNKQQYEKCILNLSKGPAQKAKSEIQKNIKNITLPKSLFQAIKESADPNNKLLTYYIKTGKYQILPAFYKLLLTLKKNKREFAIFINNTKHKDNHYEIINELNMFFNGDHPLYNGKNGTPSVKWDGSKGNKNFIVEQTHQTIVYCLGDEIMATYGTLNYAEQKDPQMFKQKFKSFKSVNLCKGVQQIYSVSHSILSQSACIYQVNPNRILVIDSVDYLTHQIYFTTAQNIKVYNCLNQQIADKRNFVVKVHLFDYLKDVDYFIKQIQVLQNNRVSQINKIQKGEVQEEVQEHQSIQQKAKMTNYEYLKKNLLPVLQGALKQVDLLRPQDPIGFIALYCLKNRDRLQ